MTGRRAAIGLGAVGVALVAAGAVREAQETSLARERSALLGRMAAELDLDGAAIHRVRTILEASPVLGQGNPSLSVHPMTQEQCRTVRSAGAIRRGDAECGAKNMVRVYDPTAGESAANARVCIDQYEFPNLPCEYPVTNVTAREAVLLCEAVGKRICDAHEWEGACAGAVRKPDTEYAWGRSREEMMRLHNATRERVWAYGLEKDHAKCATNGSKTTGCTSGFSSCGSNTYPAGAFLSCVSRFGVYDQHGNVAEHMNLPIEPSQLASAETGSLGFTEMKGSWFIFSRYEAHQDDCRWRAPDWHGSRIADVASHRNYHLGFRCCKSIKR